MKQSLLLLLSLFCVMTLAQVPCAFDRVQTELEKRRPEEKNSEQKPMRGF